MRRLFYKGKLADTIAITGSDAHHLMHVMRAKAGQEIVVVDDNGKVARMEMTDFCETSVTLRLVEMLAADTESPIEIVLVQALLKADKMDLVVQKAVELGATKVVPLVTANCVVRYDNKKAAAKCVRWQKIADEAAKQCGRTALLKIAEVTTLKELLTGLAQEQTIIFCYENERTQSIKTVLKENTADKILLVIGPEGGFSLDEAEGLINAGAKSVTLGKRILRAETAAVAAITIAQYENGDLN